MTQIIRVPYHALLGTYRARRQYWRGAARNYQRLVDAHPRSATWRYRLAHALFKDNSFESALKEIKAAEAVTALDEKFIVLKLRCLKQLESYREIEAEYETVTHLYPKSHAILTVFGETFLNQEKWQQALNCFESSLAIVEKNADDKTPTHPLYYNIGYAYSRMEKSKQADKNYKKAVSAWSEVDKAASGGLGALHMQNGHPLLAEESYRSQLKKEPHNADLHFQLGSVLSKLSRVAEAAVSYKEFVTYDLASQEENQQNDKMVVFDAYMGRNYACSPRAIYETMLKDARFKDFTFVWTTRGMSLTRHWRFLLNPRTKLVKYKTKEYFRAYARAKYWVTNSRLPFIEKTWDNQVYIQCWHGTPLKRLGRSVIDNFTNAKHTKDTLTELYDDETKKFDYFISPSTSATQFLEDAFLLKENGVKVLETGYPRNDFLYTFTPADVKKVKSRLNIPKNKKVLLYAPTWRDDQHNEARSGYVYETETDFDLLQQSLGDEWVILFRAHYFIANGFNFQKYQNFIIDVSDYDDINDLYIISDVLMTDYSSVFFDYANLKRPLIFFMYDLEHYQNDLRGFYVDLKELPGEIVKEEQAIVSILKDLKSYEIKYKNAYRAFNGKYNYLDDGHAAERVIEAIL